MDDLEPGVEVVQGADDRAAHVAQQVLGEVPPVLEGPGVELVDRGVHDLHADPDVALPTSWKASKSGFWMAKTAASSRLTLVLYT